MKTASVDREVVAALLRGDEAAFSALVERLHPRLLRLCRRLLGSDAAAEDIAQDTWQAVLGGLATFEGRCALDTWILQIAINRARSRAAREARVLPLEPDDADPDLGGRFGWLGTWRERPRAGLADLSPETAVANREILRLVAEALDRLPEQQRLVVMFRDVELMTAAEVCALLELSEENQRVLLHRGRVRLRALIEIATDEPVTAAAPV